MNANQLITALTYAEVDGSIAIDTRRVIRDERFALTAAVNSGDGQLIKAAMAEAMRVAKMWGVELTARA